jgi:hypothetical protein
VEFYSDIKKNDILSFVGKWEEFQNIILSEVSQVQKVQGCMLSFICGIQIQAMLEKTGHAKGRSHTRQGSTLESW